MQLNNISVLVTRPDTLAQPLISALEQTGARVLHYPTLIIKFLPIKNLNHYDWHIFVSRHAVRAVLPQMLKTWSMLEMMHMHWACVGPGTAQELAHFIKADIIYPHQDLGAKALHQLLEDKIKIGDTVVEWCGDNPTGVWPGAKQVMCYSREKNTQITAELLNNVNYVVVSSGTSLECLMIDALNKCKLIVISERLVTLAKTLGFKGEIILAKSADENSIINAIKGDLK